jgi:hypothetical protein
MKTLLVRVSVVLASILFSNLAIGAPPIPSDVQIVQPDPSLPKELAAFFGKWEAEARLGRRPMIEFFLIVENIDDEKASLHIWRNDAGWHRHEAKVTKEHGKYKLWFDGRTGINELRLRGKYLDLYLPPATTVIFRQVP